MKVVLLAGGFGSRLSEETGDRPKPMVEIGGRPILWHIMRWYSAAGFDDFIVCCGYKSEVIKRFFAEFYLLNSDIQVDLGTGDITYVNRSPVRWRVTLVDTGLNTMTGGRLKRVAPLLNSTFAMTYGDGLSDVDIQALLAFHRSHGRLATVTGVPSPGRFGILEMSPDGRGVTGFHEKPTTGMGYINGGFFILEPGALEVIEGDDTIWERTPLETLARRGELKAFPHHGFWKPMDTLRDKLELEGIWAGGQAPWVPRNPAEGPGHGV